MNKKDIIKKAEEVCEQYVDTYPVKIVDVCKQYGFKVFEEYLPKKESGFIIDSQEPYGKYETKKLIVVNLSDMATRRRFTIAHELGHYLLHKEKDSDLYAHRDTEWQYSEQESEANTFASNLLMPEKMVRSFIKDNENLPYYMRSQAVAEAFAVSDSAASIRLEQLNIDF